MARFSLIILYIALVIALYDTTDENDTDTILIFIFLAIYVSALKIVDLLEEIIKNLNK